MGGYWLHQGNVSMGYAGIPYGWNTLPFILAPAAAYSHLIGRYTEYLNEKSQQNPDQYYINDFETLHGAHPYYSDDDDGDDDAGPDENDTDTDNDVWNSDPSDDNVDVVDGYDDEEEMLKYNNNIAKQYAKEYMKYFEEEQQTRWNVVEDKEKDEDGKGSRSESKGKEDNI